MTMVEHNDKGKAFSKITSFEFNGKEIDFTKPRVMGIMNITPDSFYDGGKYFDDKTVRWEDGVTVRRGEEERWRKGIYGMVKEGAYILDIGAVSTRPGAAEVDLEEEKKRLLPVLKFARREYPELIISVDTWREEIARMAASEGADMINDVSGGTYDERMIRFVASSGVPYVMMHIQGTPVTMQKDPRYEDVVIEVYHFLELQCRKLKALGHHKLIVDPGFGFGKTVIHNYQLLNNLDRFQEIGFPVMAGLSRKSMINRVLGTSPDEALNGTSVLNTIALLKRVDILRVHDVKEAVQAVRLVEQLQNKAAGG